MKIVGFERKEIGELDKDYPEKIFNQLLAFQGYGFNHCLHPDTYVEKLGGEICRLKDLKIGDWIKSANGRFCHFFRNKFEYATDVRNIIYVQVKNIYHNEKLLFEITTDCGKKISSSLEHKFKVMRLSNLNVYEMKPLCEILDVDSWNVNVNNLEEEYYRLVTEDGIENICYETIKPLGKQKTIDIEVDNENHQFFANGILVSNSHSVCYSYYAGVQLYLKRHYPLEFMQGILNEVDRSDESSKGVKLLDQRVRHCASIGIKVHAPNVNIGDGGWTIHNNELYGSINNIKGFGQKDSDLIIQHRPYTCLKDFLEKTGYSKSKFEVLLFAGALDDFGDRITNYNWYYNVYLKKSKQKKEDANQMLLDFCFEGTGEIEEEIKITKRFTKQELKSLFYEYNGYSLHENILLKYVKYLEENKQIKTIYEVKKKKWKYPLMICKTGKAYSFISKMGKEWTKILLSDGMDDVELMMATAKYDSMKNSTMKEGNIIVLPVATSESDILFLGNTDKFEIKVLERE